METPADCLLRTCFLEGTFLLHVLTWWRGYGSLWGLLFIYLLRRAWQLCLVYINGFICKSQGPQTTNPPAIFTLSACPLNPLHRVCPLALLGAGHQSSRFLGQNDLDYSAPGQKEGSLQNWTPFSKPRTIAPSPLGPCWTLTDAGVSSVGTLSPTMRVTTQLPSQRPHLLIWSCLEIRIQHRNGGVGGDISNCSRT